MHVYFEFEEDGTILYNWNIIVSLLLASFFRGLDILQEVNLSSRRSTFTETALERVLDGNLPAKYALTGILTFQNVIDDMFYDTGKVICVNLILFLNFGYDKDYV